ncbi:unnamed protein product [Rhizophagus irregularis]|uniref:Protein kinase domain-containing protein n=1 Tax=Rhizophagus irregularis TaxID=588596 RepID=A0A915ZYL8_9GLOM|nr:unnamed protein product [Rhizophagus irregularis]
MDYFKLKNGLRWIPYNKFKNVEYLNEGGFGTIYRAIWLKNNGDKEDEDDEDDEEGEVVILKCPKNLNENLNEFLEEWEYHASVLASSDIIKFYGFTKDPNTSKYMVVMEYANKVSEGLNKCLIKDLGSIDENTSKLNEILESEGSQATSVKANEMLVGEDLSDYIIKDLRSLDIKTDEN